MTTCTLSRNARGQPARPAGFTLIEAVVATSIIGIGVTALFVSLRAGTKVNGNSADLTKAVFLAQEIREWTLKLPFTDPDPGDQGKPPGADGSDPQWWVDDLDDLMDVTYSPPRNGCGDKIYEMADWSETITLTWRNPDNLSQVVSPGASNIVHVEVRVSRAGQRLLTTGWFVTGGLQP